MNESHANGIILHDASCMSSSLVNDFLRTLLHRRILTYDIMSYSKSGSFVVMQLDSINITIACEVLQIYKVWGSLNLVVEEHVWMKASLYIWSNLTMRSTESYNYRLLSNKSWLQTLLCHDVFNPFLKYFDDKAKLLSLLKDLEHCYRVHYREIR